jgi:outer membrane protein OmpA-like peptidoglycan-associated protein
MPAICKQCGAALIEGNAFCTKCGARRSEVTETAQRFCTKCGAALPTSTKFCTKCGAAAGAATVAPGARATSASGATAGGPPPAAKSAVSAAKSTKPIPKAFVFGGIAVVLLVAIVGIVYAVHQARQKAAKAEAASEFEKNLEELSAKADSTAKTPNAQAPDLNKSLSDLAAAANKLSQDAQKQGNASPLNAIAGAAGAASGSSAAASSSASGFAAPADSAAAIAAASAVADAALTPPPLPPPPPIEPVEGTGDPAHDWALEYERTVGGPEADLVVRTGDINNLGFGWPQGFDPFSGKSTPPHRWPDINHIPHNAPPGTDRIMLGTSVMPVHMSIQHVAGQVDRIVADSIVKQQGLLSDGYSGSLADCFLVRDFEMQLEDPHARIVIASVEEGENELRKYWAPKCTRERELTMPTPIVLPVGELPTKINAVVVQIFADDFQPVPMHSHFQVSLDGTRIPSFEYAINSLDQSGPIGKLLTLRLLPEYWPLLKSGTVKLLIDDPTTHVPDGYAVDFVRILVNPHKFKYQVSLAATVTDAETHKPIVGANVDAELATCSADAHGKCEMKGLPAGLVIATANAPGYDENSVPVDLPAGQNGNAEIQLHRHQESTAALEQSIAQTGTATIYGIHFDTGSPKFRADSLPALEAVLGLIKGRPGSNWIIAGHTDNQGSDKINIPLSKARAASVISWLTEHGVAANRLEPQGFGSTRPVADNSTANGRFLNRRVEVALAK